MSKDIFLSVLKNQSLDTLSKDIFNTICFDTCVRMPANNLAGDPVLNMTPFLRISSTPSALTHAYSCQQTILLGIQF